MHTRGSSREGVITAHLGRYLMMASWVAAMLTAGQAAAAEPAAFASLAAEYEREIRPLAKQFCLDCHSTEKQTGELDLERFATLDAVRRGTKTWLKVAEMLDNGEMPPKKAKQPSAAQRKQLRGWIERYLDAEALARAGDPGPVVLRRLNNAQYTHTVRDLTGVDLRPAREFPTDSAAGEGFTNAGGAMVMSPALLSKYLDAGKEIARHAVLLPDGLRFSASTTRRDWTNEVLAQIRALYRENTDSGGASRVNLQGIVFDTNDGGRLPIEKYLAATLVEREALLAGRKTIAAVAKERGLNAKYLGILWKTLTDREPSLLLDVVRTQWRAAKPDGAVPLAAEIARWQQALWRFASVGHIGKVGGPKGWQEPVTPLASRQEVRLKLAMSPGQKEITLYLVASDAGDGNEHDFAVWERPRLVAPGQADLLLRDVRAVSQELATLRERVFASVAKCLAAAAEAAEESTSPESTSADQPKQASPKLATLAKRHGVEPEVLTAWVDYLGISVGGAAETKIDSHFTQKNTSSSGYDFVKGWGPAETPNVAANSSDRHVRIPGNMKPHSIAMHPSPTLQVVAGWQSPVAATIRVSATVQHAHPECGNGVTWSIEWRRGNTRQRLAAGTAQGSKEIKVGPLESIAVKPGDLVSVLIGPRDGNHACDLTAVDLTLAEVGQGTPDAKTGKKSGPRTWNLARDVSPDVLAGNPHADSFGNPGVWHFYTEPDTSTAGHVIPSGSLLAQWQSSSSKEEKQRLAEEIQKLLLTENVGRISNPSGQAPKIPAADLELCRQLSSLSGPLFSASRKALTAKSGPSSPEKNTTKTAAWGLDPVRFGKHPSGQAIEGASLCVHAPAVLEVRLPADLAAGCEFVTIATLHRETGAEGSVQFQVTTTKPDRDSGLLSTTVTETNLNGPWTSNNRRVSHATPIIVQDGSAARRRIEASFAAFREVFPAALCYTKIVPVDEVVTLTLFYREDDHLRRLMLDEAQTARLDRLWNELHFVSHDALTLVDGFQQLLEFATQDADPKVFEPLRKPIQDRAAAFRRALVEAEPRHLEAVIELAGRAYRRPLKEDEAKELRGLYQKLRAQELLHEDALRMTLARVLVSPVFLYRLEKAALGKQQGPVSDVELASRLSYFLWSSMPDQELRDVAAAGRLRDPDVLTAQAQRMLRDERVRRLATEFACQWLHIYDFDQLDEKSERHFPTFTALRGDMYEEPIRFFTDLFQRDASVLGIFNADHTFVNEALAKHYGVAGITGAEWRRIEGVGKYSRGGILGFSATLAKQSGASRTSPILRGNWVSEVLLGEKLPKPPKDVPRLPEDETATDGLTVRQLVQKHTSDQRCATCHARIDPFGFALEGFDTIGRRRDKDLANRPIDTHAKVLGGEEFTGIDGLRDYLLTTRKGAVMRQFCRKLLGYALGRGVQLSDGPLLDEMRRQLETHDYRFSVAVETIIRSRQFRDIRGQDNTQEE